MIRFFRTIILVLLSSTFLSINGYSQTTRVYSTSRIQGDSPKIDGELNDSAWDQVKWENTFTQFNPVNGGEADQQTAFKILYDDNYLYVAIRAFDNEPEKIVRRLSRRDSFQGNCVEIEFDS